MGELSFNDLYFRSKYESFAILGTVNWSSPRKNFVNRVILLSLSTIVFLTHTLSPSGIASTKNLPNKSLEQLSKNVNLIYPLVWQKTNASVNLTKSTTPKLRIELGPDSKIYSKNIRQAFDLTMKVFNGVELPQTTIFLVSNGEDEEWANKRYKELLGNNYNPENIGYGRSPNGNAVQLKRFDPSNKELLKDPNVPNGGTDAHGFTHLLQEYQLGVGDETFQGVPRWILEGSADFMQIYYLKRNNYTFWLLNRQGQDIKQHSIKFLNEYLTYVPFEELSGAETPWYITNKYPDQWAYSIGSYVCDILVALKGPSSLIQIYRDYVETKDFDKSFENIYGMPWSEAKPYVAQILYKLARR